MLRSIWPQLSLVTTLLLSVPSFAGSIKVAVASNFAATMKLLAEDFSQRTGHKVLLSTGSTGKHYAQILHGAPYDMFFAADERRPLLLEQQQRIVVGSRTTYAQGKLLLWSPYNQLVKDDISQLPNWAFQRMSMANPKLAPYGQAALQVLKHKGVWTDVKSRVVRGENIGQAYQFVRSGNAQLGFIAYSQIHLPGQEISGSWWLVPQTLYSPIKQQRVTLKTGPVVTAFSDYLQQPAARSIIESFGYQVP